MELVFLESQRVKMPHGSQSFKPGETVELPDSVALRLLELIPGKVRAVDAALQVQPDMWVDFMSPLFGLVTAKIKSVEVDWVWLTDHSVLKGEDEPCRIPVSWIRGRLPAERDHE